MTAASLRTSSGVPSAILAPKFSTVTRSEIDMTSCIDVFDDQHGHAILARQPSEQGVKRGDFTVSQARRGLVEQQQPWPDGEGSGELQHLLPAEVEVLGLGLPEVGEPRTLDDLLDAARRLWRARSEDATDRAAAMDMRADHHILENAEFVE